MCAAAAAAIPFVWVVYNFYASPYTREKLACLIPGRYIVKSSGPWYLHFWDIDADSRLVLLAVVLIQLGPLCRLAELAFAILLIPLGHLAAARSLRLSCDTGRKPSWRRTP